MKLEKVIIDGKEYYVEVKENKNIESDIDKYKNKAEIKLDKYLNKISDDYSKYRDQLIDRTKRFIDELKECLNIDEIEDLYDEYLDEIEEIFEQYLAEENPSKEKINFNFSDFGKKITDNINSIGKAINDSFNNFDKKRKFKSILPYMKQEDVNEIVDKYLNDDPEYKNLDVKELFPYISKEYANKLLLHLVEINDEKVNLVHLAPNVDNSILSVVVDKYINGELSDLKINNIYPFLKEEDITRLFNHYMKTNE